MTIEKPILNFDFDDPEIDEIRRSLYMILETTKGTQPLARDFGIDKGEIMDGPIDIVKNKYATEVIEQVDEYEPRVKVAAVVFEETDDERAEGILRPRIYCAKGDIQ